MLTSRPRSNTMQVDEVNSLTAPRLPYPNHSRLHSQIEAGPSTNPLETPDTVPAVSGSVWEVHRDYRVQLIRVLRSQIEAGPSTTPLESTGNVPAVSGSV